VGVPNLYIETWIWDEGNLEELARHGLSRRIVFAGSGRDAKISWKQASAGSQSPNDRT